MRSGSTTKRNHHFMASILSNYAALSWDLRRIYKDQYLLAAKVNIGSEPSAIIIP